MCDASNMRELKKALDNTERENIIALYNIFFALNIYFENWEVTDS